METARFPASYRFAVTDTPMWPTITNVLCPAGARGGGVFFVTTLPGRRPCAGPIREPRDLPPFRLGKAFVLQSTSTELASSLATDGRGSNQAKEITKQ